MQDAFESDLKKYLNDRETLIFSIENPELDFAILDTINVIIECDGDSYLSMEDDRVVDSHIDDKSTVILSEYHEGEGWDELVTTYGELKDDPTFQLRLEGALDEFTPSESDYPEPDYY